MPNLAYAPAIADRPATEWQSLTQCGGYTSIPNVLLDQLRGWLKRHEYDVFMYIVRRTLGFHKSHDAISISQFQHGITTHDGRRLDYGCGVTSRDTVQRALRDLEQRGFIRRWQSLTATGASGSNIYSICVEQVLSTLTGAAPVVAPPASIEGETASEEPTEAAEVSPSHLCDANDSALNTQLQNMIGNKVVQLPTKPTQDFSAGYRPNFGQGEADNQPHRIKVLQNQSQKNSTWAKAAVVTTSSDSEFPVSLPSQKVQLDQTLLIEAGLDQTTALRLALRAEQMGKDPAYVGRIISYCRKNSRSNLSGMIRKLIENGEDRTPARPARVRKSCPSGWESSSSETSEDVSISLLAHAGSVNDEVTPTAVSPENPVSKSVSFEWQMVKRTLRTLVTVAQYDAWFRNLELLELSGDVATLAAPSLNTVRYVKLNLATYIEQAFKISLQRTVQLNFVLA